MLRYSSLLILSLVLLVVGVTALSPPAVQWSVLVQGSSTVTITGLRQLAVRRSLPVSGGVVEIGTFKGTSIQVGSFTFTNLNPLGTTYDLFVVLINNNGVPVWGFSGGGTGDDYGIDIVIDNDGNFYFGGFSNSTDFQLGTSSFSVPTTNAYDFYLCKFVVSSGPSFTFTYPWCQTGGGTKADQGQMMHFDNRNNWVSLAGTYSSPVLTYGTGSDTRTLTNGNSAGTTSDGFLVLYDGTTGALARFNGNVVNGLGFGGVNNEQFVSMRCEGRIVRGNQRAPTCYIGGFYASPGLTWAGVTLPLRGPNNDAYVIAWNPLESQPQRWVWFGGSASLNDGVVDLILPVQLQADTEEVNGNGNNNGDNGNHNDNNNQGQNDADNSNDVDDGDRTGVVYIVGSYGNGFFFDPQQSSVALVSQGLADTFIIKLYFGAVKWVQTLGGAANDVGQSIGLDINNNMYVMTQYFSASVNFYDNSNGAPTQLIATNADSTQLTSDVSYIVLNAAHGALQTWTSLNGDALDYGGAMMITRAGYASFGGYTFSTNFTYNNQFTVSSGNTPHIMRLWFMRTRPPM